MDDKVISPEKAEEAKLKARYPNLGTKPGGSDLLRKRLQKGVCNSLEWPLLTMPDLHYTRSLLTFLTLSSKSTLTLVTTIWPKQRWRTSSCPQLRRRRPRSRAGTSRHLRTCLRERLQLWPANLLVDGFIVLLSFHPSLLIFLLFTCLYSAFCICIFLRNKLWTWRKLATVRSALLHLNTTVVAQSFLIDRMLR